jgi:hypothetical protein
MILEAIVLALVRSNTPATRRLLIATFLITLVMTGFNLTVAVLLFQAGILPLISIIAIAYGGFIAIYEWQLIRRFVDEVRA